MSRSAHSPCLRFSQTFATGSATIHPILSDGCEATPEKIKNAARGTYAIRVAAELRERIRAASFVPRIRRAALRFAAQPNVKPRMRRWRRPGHGDFQCLLLGLAGHGCWNALHGRAVLRIPPGHGDGLQVLAGQHS